MCFLDSFGKDAIHDMEEKKLVANSKKKATFGEDAIDTYTGIASVPKREDSKQEQPPIRVDCDVGTGTVNIEYTYHKGLRASKGGKTLLVVPEKRAGYRQIIEVNGHKIEFWFARPSSMPFVPSGVGLRVTVDGKPVSGSIDDPTVRLKQYAYALYTLGGTVLFTLLYPLLTGDAVPSADMMMAAITGVGLIALGIYSSKIPRLSIGIGAALGCLMSASYFFSMIALASESGNVQISWIWIVALGGSTLSLLRGFVLAMKLGNSPSFSVKPDTEPIKGQADWSGRLWIGGLVLMIVVIGFFIVATLASPIQPISLNELSHQQRLPPLPELPPLPPLPELPDLPPL